MLLVLTILSLLLWKTTSDTAAISAAFIVSERQYCVPRVGKHRALRRTVLQGCNSYSFRHQKRCTSTGYVRIQPVFLIPIRKFANEITFLSQSDESRFVVNNNDGIILLNDTEYEISIMEEDDIGNVAQFIVRIFGGDAINLSQNLTSIERLLVSPAVDIVNGYSSLVAFAEVFAGLRSRCSYRFQSSFNCSIDLISPPNIHDLSNDEQIRRIPSTSIVIVVAAVTSNNASSRDNPIIASVELRLQPCDAKIPFTLPWIDRIERRVFSGSSKQQHHVVQPYLSNLCVDETKRGRKIGTILVRCVENIALLYWGYEKLYLHVDLDNTAAVQLYKNEGYIDVERRWNPFWAGKAADIGYYAKSLRP